nr:MAG TPA: hypothetical protein [Caudoviricetes sp.]
MKILLDNYKKNYALRKKLRKYGVNTLRILILIILFPFLLIFNIASPFKKH